jgi:hypothetical protein
MMCEASSSGLKYTTALQWLPIGVVVWHAIHFKLENEREAQDAFEMERRSVTEEIGTPCVDTTRPSSYLKRFKVNSAWIGASTCAEQAITLCT